MSVVTTAPPVGADKTTEPPEAIQVSALAVKASSDPSELKPSLLRRALSWIPTLVVFAGLAGLGWLGHRYDWKPPVRATAPAAAGPAWCDEHGVPEDDCILCRSDLIEPPAKLDWCSEHGVRGCVLDRPELAETRKPVTVDEQDLDRAERALATRDRRENNSLSLLPGTRVQFASVEAMKQAGVEVEPVLRREIIESIAAPAEVRYDATRTAIVSPPADGIVREVRVEIGQTVQAGDVLAVIDSEKVGAHKSELAAALVEQETRQTEYDRIERAARSGAVPKQRLLEVEGQLRQAGVAVRRAVRALENFGITVDVDGVGQLDREAAGEAIRRLGQKKLGDDAQENWIAVTAPLDGRVVERTAVTGEVVARGASLFRVADTSVMWVDLRIRAEDAGLIELGQSIRFEADGLAEAGGEVSWISSDIDALTRTVRVRAEVPNPEGRLRNEQFGTGEVVLREELEAIVVPDEAVQWDGQNMLVFVRDARFFEEDRPKFFVARSVRTGVSRDGFTEIIVGVLPGEVVASEGSDVLRAQLLKSNLGAGCTCGH